MIFEIKQTIVSMNFKLLCPGRMRIIYKNEKGKNLLRFLLELMTEH